MKKYLKYFIKGFIILIGLLVISYVVLLVYVSTHKKLIIKQVTEEVEKKINGNATIGDIELIFFRTFPKVSVLFNNVVITDSLFSQHHHPFFEGKEIFAQLSITKLIKKEFAIDGLKIVNANIYLFTDTSGYTNEYLFKFKKNTSALENKTNERNELKSINLRNVNVIRDNKKKKKLYHILANKLNIQLDDKDSFLLISSKTDLLIHNLSFNLAKGSFLKEKKIEGNFDLRLHKSSEQLIADSIDVKIAGHPFNLSGAFDLQGTDPQFNLRIHTKDILYDFAKSLLPEKISKALSIVSLDKKLNADAAVNGPLKGGDPLIVVMWDVRKSKLTTPFFNFSNASFSGFFTNETDKALPRKDTNSKIQLNNFSAGWNGLTVTSGNIEILNLYKPILTADLKSDFPLITLNDILGSNSIKLTGGKGSANLTFKGPIERNNNTNFFINGEITFSDGTIMYAPREIEMKNANGKLIFKNSDVSVDNFHCVVLNNKIIMNGHANNLLTLINTEPNKVNIDWNIYSPSLNLSSFMYLLKPEKNVKHNRHKKAKLEKTSEKIDAILDRGSLHVNLKTDKLQYKKFVASNIAADISLFPESYVIHHVSMQHGGGSLDLSGSLVNRNSNYHQVTFTSSVKNVDVNKIFSAFNNFGQDGIEAKNLEGKLTAKANGTFGLNNDGKTYPGSIASTIDFSLKDGALNHYEPIKKLQNFLFKNRDFENIRFAELKDKLEIANEEVRINRMEIASTLFSIYVEGVYSTKGNTDLSVQIPLSNLKKRSTDYDPKNSGVTKKAGTSLFLRGRPGPDGTIQFKADIFNRFKKSKEKGK
ncbi:MAG TPA: AsmA-like C-terminal region-containing protein [Hanamia sp.]